MAFKSSMTADELYEWLRSKGLHQDDCHLLKENKITVESFLVLEEEHFSKLGEDFTGKPLLPKLIEEAKRDLEGSIADQIQNGDARKENGSSENPNGDIQQEKLYSRISVVEVNDSSDEEGSSSNSESQHGDADTAQSLPHKQKKIWPKDYSILDVHFINPNMLKTWRSHEGDEMNTNKIMDWAKKWNDCQVNNVPKFEKADNPELRKPRIRVEFTESRNCWSKIGRRAENVVESSDPTMYLNLDGLSSKEQKYMVIQAFGLALGLKHEHWRSDFWSIAGEHIDKGKMKRDGVDLSRKSNIDHPHDEDSIMHHWFDLNWFKNRTYQKPSNIDKKGSKLSTNEYNYLIWIHDRKCNFADAPSITDLKVLKEAYKENS